MARRPTKRRRVPGHNPFRRNPASTSAAMFESFVGIPSEHETVVEEKVFDHAHLADLARLVGFKLVGLPGQLKFAASPATRLCVNEHGTQLYLRDGDQTIDLTAFNRISKYPVDPNKESVVLGQIHTIFYAARKPFLGGEHTKTGVYKHPMGKPGKPHTRPYLVYDVRSGLLSISGGVYYIKPDDYDGKHSRGIVH